MQRKLSIRRKTTLRHMHQMTLQRKHGFKQCVIAVDGYVSVFQPLRWSGTLCSNFDCSRNPCLSLGDSRGPKGRNSTLKAESWKGEGVLGEGAANALPTS